MAPRCVPAVATEPLCDATVVVYRAPPELLRRTLVSLVAETKLRLIRVLINDEDPAEHEAALKTVRAAVPTERLRIAAPGRNVGFAAGHNQLLANAFADGATVTLIVNPDLVLYTGGLRLLLDASMRAHTPAILSGVLLLGDRQVLATEPTAIDSRGILWSRASRHFDRDHGRPVAETRFSKATLPVAGVTGALMLVRRDAYERLLVATGEFFDEDFFAYREDAELGLRARCVGVSALLVDEPVGVHYRGSPGTSRANVTANRLSVRNRFLLAMKYGWLGRPGNALAAVARDAVVVGAILVRERKSLPALPAAWRVRERMHAKRTQLRSLVGRVDLPRLPESPRVCAVVPVWQPPAATVRNVAAIARQADCVVVVDDGSTGVEGIIASLQSVPRVTLVRHDRNRGVAAALNTGVLASFAAGADLIVTFDQDSEPSPEHVSALVAALRDEQARSRRIVLIGPGQVGSLRYAGESAGQDLVLVDECIQSGLAIPRWVFELVGLFDDELVIDGVDTDFCLRTRAAAMRVAVLPSLSMSHHLGTSDRAWRVGPFRPLATGHSPERLYYITRNRLRLLGRYWRIAPRWAVVSARRLLVSSLLAVCVETSRLHRGGLIWRGVRDAMIGRTGELRRR